MPQTKESLKNALDAIRANKMVILIDDEDRENEGDLVCAAQNITPEMVNFMAKEARGLICLSLEAKRIEELALPLMVSQNGSTRSTAFTVSIEAKEGVTTGISAHDRAHTIRVACDPSKTARDLVTPGHIFPLRAVDGGVLVRAGHTEGSIDLVKLAGKSGAAVICEIMNDDGTMARLSDLKVFSQKHGIPLLTIQELIEHRLQQESLIEAMAESRMPTIYGDFRAIAFRSKIDQAEHLALVYGEPKEKMLVRVHSECLTGDVLGSLRCDCGSQLQAALAQIAKNGSGVLVYMRKQEGRGIGLLNKIKAYALQDSGLDTVEANEKLGFKPDLRHYGLGAQILRHLGVRQIELLTNNPKKIIGLEGYGLEVTNRIALQTQENAHNINYLRTKRDRMGHVLKLKDQK